MNYILKLRDENGDCNGILVAVWSRRRDGKKRLSRIVQTASPTSFFLPIGLADIVRPKADGQAASQVLSLGLSCISTAVTRFR